MTRYSTYASGRIAIVDGVLSTDPERAEEDFDALLNALTAGAARALLNSATDDADPDAEVTAEQWHSDNEGWELGALDADALATVTETMRAFLTAGLPYVIMLGHDISTRTGDWRWRDLGMAFYRIGMLAGYKLAGQGIGFDDVSHLTSILPYVVEAWNAASADVYVEPSIDSSEEPCLLHL